MAAPGPPEEEGGGCGNGSTKSSEPEWSLKLKKRGNAKRGDEGRGMSTYCGTVFLKPLDISSRRKKYLPFGKLVSG